ncbi:MAG: hypothetical protein ACP5P4_10910 [Steroidobacteraceae bacterium]
MHAAMMSAHALDDDVRRALIAAIEATCMTRGGVDAWGMIDALKTLGAFDGDQEEHVATAGAEMNEVLAGWHDVRRPATRLMG